ncbi:MAG: SCO6745 family protein [Jatrophihabitantaceae bacterium]
MPEPLTRRLWQHYELIHDLIYFSQQARDGATALGLRGFWMGYFAFRLAPLGALDAAAATAVCYGFHPSRVARALPDAWRYADPASVVAARQAAADQALRAVLGPAAESAELAEAAELAWAAAQQADIAGRPLAAANQALPRPELAHVALWQASTVLREHRGDGHNAVLISRALGPLAAHLIKLAAGESDEQLLRIGRGFTDGDWTAGRRALLDRGLLDEAGRLTEAGEREHQLVEELTDTASERPWQALGEPDSLRLLALLRPLAGTVAGSGVVPALSPVGVVRSD